jgi:aspartate/glutamate racemase
MSGPVCRIALIHALAESVAPINDALARDWPQARRMNLLDDSLSADLAASGGVLDETMTARFIGLADYAVGTGADAILFTCSAFGSCIEAAARRHAAVPVLKPNEAMIEEAVARGQCIGLLATFAPTLESMPREFPPETPLQCGFIDGALAALQRGDCVTHDQLVADAAVHLKEAGCEVIALAQFSLARAAPLVARRTGLPVLTTVDSAVRALRTRLVGRFTLT